MVFSRAWMHGSLVLDGPGASLWVKIALDHWWTGGIPYWIPELWAGTPAWALAPTFPVLSVLPLAALVGPEQAVKIASLAAQVVGAWGVVVLARSLWKESAVAPLVAGLVYALHPLLVAHLALAGHQPSIWVMAITPWLVWAFIGSLRGRGRRWTIGAGLLAGAALLEQPEHVYGLALLATCILCVQLISRRERSARAGWTLVGRAAAVGAIALGVAAYWLLPFLSLSKSFVLTPPAVARQSLVRGVGSAVGRQPSLFLSRARPLTGTVDFDRVDFVQAGGFYLSWVCVALTLSTVILLLVRRDREGHLAAILLGSVLALWTSTGGVPFSSSRLVDSGAVVFVILGAVAGLIVGNILARVRSRRMAIGCGVLTAVLLAGTPYTAPFLSLQEVVPLLRTVRFPRLYPVAVLGLALGTAFPLTVVHRWAAARRPDLTWLLMGAVSLAVAGVFLVDAWPYLTFYRVHPPPSGAAYRQATDSLSAVGDQDFRLAGSLDPPVVTNLLDTGHDVTTGWPHAVASKDVWRLTFEPLAASPAGYREAALGLSGTAYTAAERRDMFGPGGSERVVEGVLLVRNPHVLPLVRTYDQAVVLDDRNVTAELAVALSQRNVGVVTGGQVEARRLGDASKAVIPPQACSDRRSAGATSDGAVNAEVAIACAMHRWTGLFNDVGTVSLEANAGGVFRPGFPGLKAIAVWLDRDAGMTEMSVQELRPDGRTLGPVIGRAKATGVDENGMALFPLDPKATVPGRQYAFLLTCPRCLPEKRPRMVTTDTERSPANLIVDSTLDRGRVAAFAPLYERLASAPAPGTSVQATRLGPGRWRVDSSGSKASLVVIADAWFPGWTAKIDGRAAQVMEADGGFLGVAVGPGKHRVDVAYGGPRTVLTGKLLSMLTLGAALPLLVGRSVSLRRLQLRRPKGDGGEGGPATGGRIARRGRQTWPRERRWRPAGRQWPARGFRRRRWRVRTKMQPAIVPKVANLPKRANLGWP